MKPGKSTTILTSLLVTGAGIYVAIVSREHFLDRVEYACMTCGVSKTSTHYVGVKVHAREELPAYAAWVRSSLPQHNTHQWVFRHGYSRGWQVITNACGSRESSSLLPELHAKFGDVPPLRELLIDRATRAERGELDDTAMWEQTRAVETTLASASSPTR
ncbi:MAG: hypothetical protein EPO68_16585 [Planctomycetota bacterium]|nr:MAG: hypothetical protein EPO68_16585 [Planctomycetota bacterium]